MEQHRETEAQQVERFAVENLEIEGRGLGGAGGRFCDIVIFVVMPSQE